MPRIPSPVPPGEVVPYGGWPRCVRLRNDTIELIATTDVGPRIIRFGFVNSPNLFKEYPSQLGKTGGKAWLIYGGHRLWHAPESAPRTYSPDNEPIAFELEGDSVVLRQDPEPTTGIEKQITVSLGPRPNEARVVHRLTNRGLWTVELAPWALSVMAPGGRAIFPQEPYRPHPQALLPARPLVLWAYTDMADPRWTWGTRYIQLRQDPARATPQKAGLFNGPGWTAYVLDGQVMVKRFAADPTTPHADMGANTESFTNAEMLEVETLGPLARLAPGEHAEHTEHWYLFRASPGETDDELDRTLLPLLEETETP